jgi:hypothetical protein
LHHIPDFWNPMVKKFRNGIFLWSLRLCFLYPDLSLTDRMSDSYRARQRARSSNFIVSESLIPIWSNKGYYLKVPLRVLV